MRKTTGKCKSFGKKMAKESIVQPANSVRQKKRSLLVWMACAAKKALLNCIDIEGIYYKCPKDFIEAVMKLLAGDIALAAMTDKVKHLRRKGSDLKGVVA